MRKVFLLYNIESLTTLIIQNFPNPFCHQTQVHESRIHETQSTIILGGAHGTPFDHMVLLLVLVLE
jgi:hypothetical protein